MLKRLIILTLFIVSFNAVELYACDCQDGSYDSIQTRSFNNANLVFYGELINYDSISYKYSFRIFEIFKGEFKRDTIYGRASSSCSLCDFDKGLWIVYATYNDDSTIDISHCGASRSMTNSNPNMIAYLLHLPTKVRQTEITLLEYKIDNLEIKRKATIDWFTELEKLRHLSKRVIPEKESQPNKMFNISLIVFNLLLLIIIGYLLMRKRL